MSVILGFFLAIGFGAQHSLSPNEWFIYPLQQISHPSCKFEDRDTLSGKCVIDLPRIKGADYDKYTSDTLVRGVYSVLWASSYDDGRDRTGGHSGVDFRTSRGTPLVSIGNGVIVDAWFNKGYGNVVKAKYMTPEGKVIYAIYAHLDVIAVSSGQKVEKGQKVGTVGDTGMSYGVHLHYEIDTTTRWGKPLYPYLECEEKDAYIQNNTNICVDMLRQHTKDPIEFHEKYLTTLVASTKPVPVQEPTPKPSPKPTPSANITALIEWIIIQKKDTKLQPLYDVIKKHVPSFDPNAVSSQAQSFLQTYGIEVTHALSPTTRVGEDTKIELYIYNKNTRQPFTWALPVSISALVANANVRTSPSSITDVHNGRVVIRISGAQRWPSVIGLAMDNSFFYALPVVVE